MATRYTPGKASQMFNDFLGPYLQEYNRKKELRDYKAPLGERNVGILNAVLASANTIKNINDTIEANKIASKQFKPRDADAFDEFNVSDFPVKQRPEAILRKGKRAILGPGVEPVRQMQDGGLVDFLIEQNPEYFQTQSLSKIKERPTALNKVMNVKSGVGKGKSGIDDISSIISSAQLLDRSRDGVEKAAAIYNIAEKLEKGGRGAAAILGKKATEEVAKKTAKEVGKKAGKTFLGKLAPGVGTALGIKKISESRDALGKASGFFDAAGSVASLIPGVGTIAGGVLGGIGTGLEMLRGR